MPAHTAQFLQAGCPSCRLTNSIKALKEQSSILWSHHEETRELPEEIMQGTMPDACRRGRPRTAWTDNIKMWTGLPVEESVRMAEDRDKWRKYVHSVANPRIEDS